MNISRKKIVIVTGASGFVGQHIVNTLLERNIRVIAVIRDQKLLSSTHRSLLDDCIEIPDLFSCDIRDLRRHFSRFSKIDAVIHAAWYTKHGQYLNSQENIICLEGTVRFAKFLQEVTCQRFVGIGTCFEYDLSAGVLTTDTPLKPESLYSACKVAAFHILQQIFTTNIMSFAWCRLFYLFGPGEDEHRLVPYIRNQIEKELPVELTSGLQIRDFLDIRMAASSIVDVALSDFEGPINICSGIPITVRQLAEQIAQEYGRKDLLRFGVRPDNFTDPRCVIGIPTLV